MIKVLVCTLLFSLSAFADGGPKFGPEFTFAKPDGSDGSVLLSALKKVMFEHLVEGQRGPQKFNTNEFRPPMHPDFYFSPNNWWFGVGTDHGVVEVAMKPMKLGEIEAYIDHIQDAIFVSAANANLIPGLFVGGGHISIDYNYFIDKPLLYRNFIVDLYNHNELFMGVFNFDTNNAVSYSLLEGDFHRDFKKLIAEFDYYLQEQIADTDQLSTNMLSAVHHSKDPYRSHWNIQTRANKTTAINLERAKQTRDGSRIELRGFRPQNSAYIYLNQVRLIKKRLDYLRALGEPIEIRQRISHHADRVLAKDDYNTPPVDPQEALQAFYEYVTESGEKWEDHQDYLWPKWISDGEVKKFNRRLGLCSNLLEPSA